MFSFIIPAFNEEKYIGPCLDAIFALDGLGDSEVIVVDNASTDATAGIVREKYPRVTLVSESRKGTGWARQAGLEAAHGDYVCYIDADNLVPAQWLRSVRRLIDARSDSVAYTGPYNQPYNGFVYVFEKMIYRFVFYPLNKILNIGKRGGLLVGGNMVIRRDALKRIGGFDTDIVFWGDDTLLGKRLGVLGTITFSFRMAVMTSPRRPREVGYIRSSLYYAVNAVWALLFNKPFHRSYRSPR